ncbi:MAG TPA: SUMF1/EgtB/PvdO family nonheme iron enzyme [Acidobacteriota bacterium]|nr:SUMF1/EgtB/PvdO family nonheme iron enzyme [Acidobacteriota bacterium]
MRSWWKRAVARVMPFAVLLAVLYSSNSPASCADPPQGYSETVLSQDGQKIEFDMAFIPGGTFTMGSLENEEGRKANEGPEHEVRVDAFYLSSTETTLQLFLAFYRETVTQKEDWMPPGTASSEDETGEGVDAITGPTPVYGDMTMGHGEANPAMGMTWRNAVTFCRWLTKKTGREYRLPTEAEWEYACRAGSTSVYGSGANLDDLTNRVWFRANSGGKPHGVGEKEANAWGLYDMAGNVREWVHDFYSPEAYAEIARTNPVVNPRGPDEGRVHVARGGYHRSPTEELRCAARAFEQGWWRNGDPQLPKSVWWIPSVDFIGFRVARSVDGER